MFNEEEKKLMKQEILKRMDEFFDKDKNKFDYEDIDGFSNQLESDNVITYSLLLRTDASGMDSWIQAEGYVTGIPGLDYGIGVIFEYECPRSFDRKEEFADYLIEMEEEFQMIKSRLTRK